MGSNDERVMIDHFIMLKENFIGTIFNSAAIISILVWITVILL